MANRAYMNFGHFYANHAIPALIDCQFKVDSTQGSGVSGLVSNGYIKNVFMHSSAPSGGNPNPANGVIAIQLSDNYSRLLNIMSSIQSPNSGSDLAVNGIALTIGNPYVITTLGSATAADWTALGVPAGVTPAVGVSFIAKVTGTGSSATSKVQAPSQSGIVTVEQIGSPQLGPQGVSNQGGWIFLQTLDKTDAQAAPAAGSIISLNFLLDSSSVSVDGD